ncbi:hypothetical protein [Jiulongibacter sp. NS-SX5]|uniref:hypothetical protein n=1 Tax=Jiulongibacter sp. NS-SX5 TaxID=3463854 RepID=UPI00405874AB
MKKLIYTLLICIAFFKTIAQNSTIFSDRVQYPKHTTTDRLALSNLVAGQAVYDSDLDQLFIFTGTEWVGVLPQNTTRPDVIKTGEAQYSETFHMAADGFGNIYLGGFSTGEVIIDNTLIMPAGTNNLFLIKLDAEGNLLWQNTFGGSDEEQMGAITADSLGNVYFTGTFRSNFTLGSTSFSGSSDFDVFLSKFNSSGTPQWSVRENAPGSYSSCQKIVVDNQTGNVTIAGNFNGSSTFGGTTINTSGNFDNFIAQYNSSGSLNWVKSFGGTSQELVQELKQRNGRILLCGQFSGSASIDANTIYSFNGGIDAYALVLTNSGTFEFLRALGGIGSEQEIKGELMSDNTVAVALKAENSFSFQSKQINLLGPGRKIVLFKLDATGNYLSHKIDLSPSSGAEATVGSVMERKNGLFLSGYVSNGPVYVGSAILGASANAGFIANYDSNFGFNWAKQNSGAAGSNLPFSFKGFDDSVLFSGSFNNNTVFFGHNLGVNTQPYGLFVVKIP